MSTNYDTKVYPGGIRNKIRHVTVRLSAGCASYMDGTPGQNTAPHGLITRVMNEPPESRKLNPYTKDGDV